MRRSARGNRPFASAGFDAPSKLATTNRDDKNAAFELAIMRFKLNARVFCIKAICGRPVLVDGGVPSVRRIFLTCRACVEQLGGVGRLLPRDGSCEDRIFLRRTLHSHRVSENVVALARKKIPALTRMLRPTARIRAAAGPLGS